MKPDKKMLTKREVAEILSLSVRTISRLMSRGDLRYRKIGGSVRFEVAEVESLFCAIEEGCHCGTDCGCAEFRRMIDDGIS